MPLPRTRTVEGADALAALVHEPARSLLAFDFDGVLAPIVADPSQSRAHPAVVPALVRLAPHLGAVAIITGRPAAVAVDYAGLAAVEGLEELVVFGHYGAERWDAGTATVTAPPVHPGVAAVRSGLADVLERTGVGDAVHVEDKGRSVAVHTRRAPDPQVALEALRIPLAELAEANGLTVEPGRMVIELRPPGVDKGEALRRFAGERSAAMVGYVGDDLGDLPAFAAVDDLRRAGTAGLKVCSGSSEVAGLAEQADLVVDGPDGVVELLTALAEELDRA